MTTLTAAMWSTDWWGVSPCRGSLEATSVVQAREAGSLDLARD